MEGHRAIPGEKPNAEVIFCEPANDSRANEIHEHAAINDTIILNPRALEHPSLGPQRFTCTHRLS